MENELVVQANSILEILKIINEIMHLLTWGWVAEFFKSPMPYIIGIFFARKYIFKCLIEIRDTAIEIVAMFKEFIKENKECHEKLIEMTGKNIEILERIEKRLDNNSK